MNPRQRRLRRLRRKDRKVAHEAEIYRRFAADRSRSIEKQRREAKLKAVEAPPVSIVPTPGSLLSTMLQGKPIP